MCLTPITFMVKMSLSILFGDNCLPKNYLLFQIEEVWNIHDFVGGS